MKTKKTTLLIPVESQIREFDAKLLLACIAARRGFSSVIGSRQELKSRIGSFPRSIYIAKDLMSGSKSMFKIMRKLGCEIVAWDEEALVHTPAETYFARRLSPIPIRYVSQLLAWGQDNVDLWRQYPELPEGTPIHITGNPRGDLLRAGIRVFYKIEVDELREKYNDFILVNTNFSAVNAFRARGNLFQPIKKTAKKPKMGRRAQGMSREYAEGLRQHKQAILEDFQRLIPALEQAFSDYIIVVRPHPGENQEIYHSIATRCERVLVTNEGNVLPWLMAARALIHNGCTTGVEAYVMGVPAISFRATVNDYYDYAFHHLPNLLSHQCFDLDELQVTLGKILSGELGPTGGHESEALIDHFLAARNGPLACDRIVDVLEKTMNGRSELVAPPFADRLKGHYKATRRNLKKRFISYLPGSHNKPRFDRHRYPGVSLGEVHARVSRFQQVLGVSSNLKIVQIGNHIFRISAQREI
jgi:surface carbohydrate biosynthesis protein